MAWCGLPGYSDGFILMSNKSGSCNRTASLSAVTCTSVTCVRCVIVAFSAITVYT